MSHLHGRLLLYSGVSTRVFSKAFCFGGNVIVLLNVDPISSLLMSRFPAFTVKKIVLLSNQTKISARDVRGHTTRSKHRHESAWRGKGGKRSQTTK